MTRTPLVAEPETIALAISRRLKNPIRMGTLHSGDCPIHDGRVYVSLNGHVDFKADHASCSLDEIVAALKIKSVRERTPVTASPLDRVPRELRALPQWVCWRREERNGRSTKVPYASTGHKASVTDPSTWCGFAEAVAVSGFDGVGFVLTADDPFVGVDLDHCIDDAGQITPEAQAIVNELSSYTEVTPSGRGLRMFVRGSLPAGRRKKGDVEVYDSARFLTVTGHDLAGTPTTVEERSTELLAIHHRVFGEAEAPPPTPPQERDPADDRELLARALRRDRTFARLWLGDISGYPSHSEADLALASRLAYWTGRDPIRIDRLFRGSKLFRAKWDDTRGDQTYGQITIAEAIKGCRVDVSNTESNEDPWGHARPAPDFVGDEEAEPEWIEPKFLAPGSVTEFFSPRGIGKTHVAHALAVKLALAGKRVLLLDRDNSRREVRRRLRGWGAADVPTLKVMTREHVRPLTDRAAWADFPIAEYDAVMLDSLDSASEGVGEKDSSRPSLALASALDVARQTDGPAILVLGNTVKSGEHSRGSGVVEDRADIAYEVRDATDFVPKGRGPWWLELPPAGAAAWGERASRRKRRDTYRLAFIPSKFRIGEEPEPFILEINLSTEPWTMRDVTSEVTHAGDEAREHAVHDALSQRDRAMDALAQEVKRRAVVQKPMNATEAEHFLRDLGLKRRPARELIADGWRSHRWRLESDESTRGHPTRLLPVKRTPIPAVEEKSPRRRETYFEKSPLKMRAAEGTSSADRMDSGRRKTPVESINTDAQLQDTTFHAVVKSDCGRSPVLDPPRAPRTPLT